MATEYTPNYNLDLYAGTDKPNLRDQYNAAMGKIDTQMKANADAVTNANANVNAMQTQVTKNKDDISELESTVEAHGTQITAAQSTADDALSLAQTNESDIASTESDVTSLKTQMETANSDIDALQSQMSTANGSISRIDGEVDGKAPTDHSSTQNTYGLGNGTEYGHLKLADSAVNLDANSGTAATPQCVSSAMSTATSNAVSQTESRNSLAGYKLNSVTSGFADSAVSGTVKIITHNGAGCINITTLNVNNTQASIRWVNVVYLDTYGFQFTGSPEITNTIMTTDGVNIRQMRIVNSGNRPVLQISVPNSTNWTFVGQVSFIYTTAGARALAEGIETLSDADDDTMYILG